MKTMMIKSAPMRLYFSFQPTMQPVIFREDTIKQFEHADCCRCNRIHNCLCKRNMEQLLCVYMEFKNKGSNLMIFENAAVLVIKSKRKTISIQVKPNKVIVRAPLKMKENEIEDFVESKRIRIEKYLKSVAEKQKLLQNTEPYSEEEIKNFVAQSKEIIPPKVKFYADKIGVTYNKISIRCQRTRWGSCSSKGNLNFNCLLVLLPDEIIDSVVVHELCHRKQMNHSVKFYEEIEKVFPDYKRCHLWLNQNGIKYMSRYPK